MRAFSSFLILCAAAGGLAMPSRGKRGSMLSPRASTNATNPNNLPEFDYNAMLLALNLETLERSLWGQARNNFTAAQFQTLGLGSWFLSYIDLLEEQESNHVLAIESLLGLPAPNCTYDFSMITDPNSFLAVSQVITSVGEGAYLGASPNITVSDILYYVAPIIGNEARQNSLLRSATNGKLNFFDGQTGFESPLTAMQAYSLAAPMIKSCSSGVTPALSTVFGAPLSVANATMLNSTYLPNQPQSTNFTIPAMTASLTWQRPVGANYTVNLLESLGVAVVTALNVTYITAPVLNVTDDGAVTGIVKATLPIPPGVFGTTFAFLVNGTVPSMAPVPDDVVVGVTYLVPS